MGVRIDSAPFTETGTGDISGPGIGPGASTDNAVVRWNGTDGSTIQNSTAIISDAGALTLNPAAGADTSLDLLTFNNAANQNPTIRWENTTDDGGLKFSLGASVLGSFNDTGYWMGTGFQTNGSLALDNVYLRIGGWTRLAFSTTAAEVGVEVSEQTNAIALAAMFRSTAGVAGAVAIQARGATSQTADLFQAQNSSNTVLMSVKANGRLQADSGFGTKRTTTATSYTVLVTDHKVGVTSNAAARTITLPAASACTNGQEFVIKDEAGTANSANNITIARAGADTIDGATSITISADYGVCRLYSNGSNAFFTY